MICSAMRGPNASGVARLLPNPATKTNASGRKLKAVEGLKVRPTADKVKEAVFSSVNAYIYDCEFLDVFGGTGAMALEAVSRGAKEAVILEKDRDAQKTIIDNIALCGFAKKCVLLKGDSLQSLEKIGREKRQFDLIYVDPPYQAGLYQNVLENIAAGNLLKKEGLILTETPREMEVSLGVPCNYDYNVFK